VDVDAIQVCTGTSSSAFNYSPLAYNMLKGVNPYSNYTIKIATINFGAWNLYGDPSDLLIRKFPDADLIVAYQSYYYICYKNVKE